MSKREIDTLYFLSFCIEQYKMHKGLSGGETMRLFDQCHVTEYLTDNYEALHTQSAQWLIDEIDEYIKDRNR